MTFTNILLLIIALFTFLDWYEHSKDIPKVMVKYKHIRCNTVQVLKKLFKR